LEIVNIFFRR